MAVDACVSIIEVCREPFIVCAVQTRCAACEFSHCSLSHESPSFRLSICRHSLVVEGDDDDDDDNDDGVDDDVDAAVMLMVMAMSTTVSHW